MGTERRRLMCRQRGRQHQLSIVEPLHYGFKGFQDAIVALR
jgi:hypothetical protein